MSLRALDWDRGGVMLHTLAHDHLPLLKGKGASQEGSYHCHLASVLGWIEDGHVEMQSQDSNGSKSHWQSSYAPHWNGGEVVEDAVTPSKPSGPSSNKEGTLEAVVSETAAAEAPVAPNISYQDDEMVSWLQYPLDDSLERSYCSDFFGELPSSNMQVVKESFVGQGVGRLQHMPISNMEGSDAVGNKAASAEAAMALGAGRAAGVIPQTGAEAFSKVRTLQPLVSKWPPHSITPHSSKGFGVYPTTASQVPPRTSLLASRPLSAPMPPPKPQPRPGTSNLQVESARKLARANFSHFSRSAAIMKNYHQVGVFSGMPSNILNKQPLAKANFEASTSTGSSIAESTTTGRSGMDSQKDIEIHLQGSNSQQQQNPGVDSSRGAVPPIPVTRKEVEPLVVEGEAVVCNTKPATAEQDTFRMSRVTGSTSLESADKGTPQQGRQVPDAQEPTIASSSGGSGNSAERTKEASTSNKRKAAVTEETECQSEDGDNESADLKKPSTQGRTSTTKRTRAAEVHNLSERRRRDRINEKMKALQELIPNSNKTDKASMLDEAIEYLKMLQLQLHMMSMRSGMSLPPMVMPAGMQHLQISQMTAIPPLGMGMGMGMGMGLGMGMGMGLGMSMMDMAASGSGRPGMPLTGPSHKGNMPVTSMSMVDVHDPRLVNPNVMDPLNAYLACQHQPLQIPQPMNMDMYNAYIMQQHQHRQHQHQQQSTNMGGGPPQ